MRSLALHTHTGPRSDRAWAWAPPGDFLPARSDALVGPAHTHTSPVRSGRAPEVQLASFCPRVLMRSLALHTHTGPRSAGFRRASVSRRAARFCRRRCPLRAADAGMPANEPCPRARAAGPFFLRALPAGCRLRQPVRRPLRLPAAAAGRMPAGSAGRNARCSPGRGRAPQAAPAGCRAAASGPAAVSRNAMEAVRRLRCRRGRWPRGPVLRACGRRSPAGNLPPQHAAAGCCPRPFFPVAWGRVTALPRLGARIPAVASSCGPFLPRVFLGQQVAGCRPTSLGWG